MSLFLLGFGCSRAKLRRGQCRRRTRKVVCVVGIPLGPGLRNRLSKKIPFFFRVGGGRGGGGTPGVVVLAVEPQESRDIRVTQRVVGRSVGVARVQVRVLDVGLDLPGALILDEFLVVLGGVKPQAVLGGVFSLCDEIQGVVGARLPAPPAAVVRPGSSLFEMVDAPPSPLAHWGLPDLDVVVASVVNDIIGELDLLRPGLRLGPSEHWQVYWFLLRHDFFWAQL